MELLRINYEFHTQVIPSIRINPRTGYVTLNSIAVKNFNLESKRYCRFFVDRKLKKVKMQFSSTKYLYSLKFHNYRHNNRHGLQFRCPAFSKSLAILETRVYDLKKENEFFVFYYSDVVAE